MKSMRKLTVKNLLLNKTRTLVTMIGILLAAALITMVSCMALSLQQTAINFFKQKSGDYTAAFMGEITAADFRKYQENPDVQHVFGISYPGFAKNENPKYESIPYINILALTDGAFENGFNMTLQSGRYPKTPDEIVLSKQFVKSTRKEYQIGDTLSLDIGYFTYTNSDTGETFDIPNGSSYFLSGFDYNISYHKTYTVVGITDNVSDDIDTATSYGSQCVNVYTAADIDKDGLSLIYTRFTPDAEQNYAQTIAKLLGTKDASLITRYLDPNASYRPDLSTLLENNHLEAFSVNEGILRAKLIRISIEDAFMVAVALVIVYAIIIISSIFIIRNSFYISISEKAKLYGMLSSIGATPRQIRANVFFEGFIIGLISIPVGLAVGVFGTAGLVQLCNTTLHDVLGGVTIQFAVAWQPIAMALILCAGTIFMSVLSPAIETSRISPIEAIRGNREVNISKRKQKKAKSYKTPKIISRMFGVGGSIAWKNLKRSKAKYRATVISITVSVAIYLAVSTVIGCLVSYVESSYSTITYNMMVFADEEFNTVDSSKKYFAQFHQLADRDEISEAALQLYYPMPYLFSDFPDEKFSDEWQKLIKEREFHKDIYGGYDEDDHEDDSQASAFISVIDDDTYNEIAKSIGYTPQKGKYMLLDRTMTGVEIYDQDGNFREYENKHLSYFKDMEGYTLKLLSDDAYYYEKRKKEPDFEENWGYIYKDGYMEKYGTPIEITIGAVITPENGSLIAHYMQMANMDLHPHILVNEEWFLNNVQKIPTGYWFNNYLLHSTNDIKTEDALDDMGFAQNQIRNISKEVETINAVSFIMQFFVYSFIGILTLIGLTNVFNTINTNMNLRKKEFAALRSIGMTTREFDNMITLESFFYTFKALLIGVPIGLVLGWLAYDQFNKISYDSVSYTFPWIPLLLSVGVVALLVWLIMTVSIRKVRNQNIIETIRSDNI